MYERWIVLAVLTFARTTMSFQFQSVAAVSTSLVERFHIGYATIGTLIGLYLLPGIAVALLGGVLGQRYGDRRILCMGLAGMVLGGLLMAVADNLPVLLIGRILSGAGGVLLNVMVGKLVTDWFQGREIVSAMGIMVTSWPLGIALALALLPSIAGTFSWAGAMFVTAAITMAALLLVLAFCRDAPSVGAASSLRKRVSLTRLEILLSALAGLVWTFYNAGYIVIPAFGPAFLTASGSSAATAAAAVSTASWVAIPAVPIGAWLAERIGRPNSIMIAFFLLSASAIGAIASVSPSAALFAIAGFTLSPPAPLIMTLPGEAARHEQRAVAMGIYYTCYYAGMGVLPAISGYARDLSGSAAAPLWVGVAMLPLAGACLLLFRYVQDRSPE